MSAPPAPAERSPAPGIGARAPRVEDPPLLRGEAHFIEDLNRPRQAYAAFVRAPFPNAEVVSIDATALSGRSGLLAVWTARDLEADGIGRIAPSLPLRNRDGSPIHVPVQSALTWRARFVGDTIAMVVAGTREAAAEAALELPVEYRETEPVVDPARALEPGSPLVWPEIGTNLALDWESGDPGPVEAAFAGAAHVCSTEIVNNRVVVAALETRGALAEFDPAIGRYTLWTPTQGGTPVQLALAGAGLGVAPSAVRVLTPAVGGGFGIKNGIYPEQILVCWAARKLGRPIKWTAERSDAFLTDYHARDHRLRAELALDAEGRFLAIRSEALSNMGAYLNGAAPVIPTAGGTRMLANVYRIPLAHARTRCVYTHTAPISAYRGAGKPEYAHLVERLVDAAAEALALSPVELRRRNLIAPNDLPWRTPTGLVYDSGDFAARMDEALEAAGWSEREPRRRAARARGQLYGMGFSVYTEPDGFKDNRVRMSFDPAGHLTVVTSAQTNGQGHASAYTQIAQTLLGLPAAAVEVVEGDTDLTGYASGSGGSRSTTVTGAAMHANARALTEKGRRIAAHLLEADPGDVVFEAAAGSAGAGGGPPETPFRITGTDAGVSWSDVAAAAHDPARLPAGLDPGLESDHHYDAPVYCYPSGCHVCEVEIDPETGEVRIVGYLCASDLGTVVNPGIVEGQLHGGIAQGLGQGVFERTVYDPESGQLLSASFMDYCLPRASQLPAFELHRASIPCTTNPLGVKGVGESGPTAALPAVANAVHDALRGFDRRDLQMPFTPERIWRLLRADTGAGRG